MVEKSILKSPPMRIAGNRCKMDNVACSKDDIGEDGCLYIDAM